MDEWICCNKCYRSMKGSRKEFSVTSCQHVFCSQCVETHLNNIDKKQCPVCSSLSVSTMTLQKPLQRVLVPYFQMLSDHTEQICQTASFHRSQALVILCRSCQTEEKYELLKKTYCRSAIMKKELDAACERLEEELKRRQLVLAACQARERSIAAAGAQALLASSRHNPWKQTPSRAVRKEVPPVRYDREALASSPNDSKLAFGLRFDREWPAGRQIEQQMHEGKNLRMVAPSYPFGGKYLSDRQSYAQRNVVLVGLHEYSPRAILSDDSPDLSATPVLHKIPLRNFGSLYSSSNMSSSDGTPGDTNYYCNYLPRF